MTVSKVLKRKDVPQESQWNGKAIFASWDEWEAEMQALTADLPQIQTFNGQLAQGPTVMANWLELVTSLDRRLFRLMMYAHMPNMVDANDMVAKEHMDQFVGLFTKLIPL